MGGVGVEEVAVYRFLVFTTPSLLHEEKPRRVTMYYQIC
jgi:hypothetical protein